MSFAMRALAKTPYVARPAVADVFSTLLYSHTYHGADTDTYNDGLDRTASDSLVWFKARTTGSGSNHVFFDSIFGYGDPTDTFYHNSAAKVSYPKGLRSVSATGMTIDYDGSLGHIKYTGTFAAWTFMKRDFFFFMDHVTKVAASDKTVDLSSLGTVGMVFVKSEASGSWYAWHRELTAGKLLLKEYPAAEATLGHITVSGTTLTLKDGVIADGNYVVYAWAHDIQPPGIVQCLQFSTDGSGNASIDPGWAEGVQWIILKAKSTTGSWEMYDTARTPSWTGDDEKLLAESSAVAATNARLSASGTALNLTGLSASQDYVCMVIRGA